jgi:hypothetical protein
MFVPIGTQQVLETRLLQFKVTANDPDGDGVIYSVDALPLGASFNTLTQEFTWAPNSSQAGNYSVNFKATYTNYMPSIGGMAVAIVVGDVPTPCESANQVINTVISLSLPKNVENSYMANLKKVCNFVESGNKTPAINQLRAFIQKVYQDMSHGIIGSVSGNNLIILANQLIVKIQG